MERIVNVEKYGFTSKNLKTGDEVAIFSFEDCFDDWMEYDPDAEMHFIYAKITGLWIDDEGFDIEIEKDGNKHGMSINFDMLEDVTVRTEVF